ncbi:BPSS1780 family membrane protein [Candidatus Vallotia lariciata]|uniref:BPSS1780 family membrane protein n=1 Tax=Candidatus Vallotia laricis TaxID=2018052 RepID=UPI001D02EB2C|nr:BPSS1780 family membrane protein [Candidatus Vallotia lariciata]UDG83149.1 hypothetical protein GKR41_00535 [Candidatus Vallotia lariciata]
MNELARMHYRGFNYSAMRLIETSAKSGYIWIGKGIRLFRKNPIHLLSIFFTYLFSMTLVIHMPVVGSMLWIILMPGLFVGFMSACRDVLANRHICPLALFTGFRAYGAGVAWRLLKLGLIYYLLVSISLFLTSMIDDSWPLKTFMSEVKSYDNIVYRNVSLSSIILRFVIYIPTNMLFWFAPMLTAWHSMPPVKAMFFSFVACWRNRVAFLVYLAAWFAVIMGVSLVLAFILNTFSVLNIALTLLLPGGAILWTVIYCSLHISYCGCFSCE